MPLLSDALSRAGQPCMGGSPFLSLATSYVAAKPAACAISLFLCQHLHLKQQCTAINPRCIFTI